ncbi:snaclec botrocetin subunit alpha-like [Vanacampus margaritifer]
MAFALGLLLLICGIGRLFTTDVGPWKSDRCPKYWTQLNNRCYIFEEENLSWDEAESRCNYLGGHLASIHSFLQLLVIGELSLQKFAWIGLYTSEENVTMWTDGSSTSFVLDKQGSFKPGCYDIMGHDLAVFNCSFGQPFVCARDLFQCVSICTGED